MALTSTSEITNPSYPVTDRGDVMESRRQAFLSAAVDGELDDLKDLIAEHDDGKGLANTVMSFNNEKGIGVIHLAASKGKLDILNYLIDELGIDVDTRDGKGDSPLSHGIVAGNMHSVEYLLGKGADAITSNIRGLTPLHHAAVEGHTEILRRLLSRGVNVNALSKVGTTPLEMAAGEGQLEVIQILLDHNANPDFFSRLFTPLTSSIISGLPQSLQCVELLLKAGADPDGGSNGLTPLVGATMRGSTEIVKLLIQAGADPDVSNSFGQAPLELAALYGYDNIAEILFPVTSRIPEYVDWSIDGVTRHLFSDQAKEQRKLKASEKFNEAKLNGADALKKQDYIEAVIWYTQAMGIDPSDASVLSNRSMCFACMKEGEQALLDASECVQLRPDWPEAYYRAGVALNLLKRYDYAEKIFLKGLKLSPDNQELKDALREAVEAQLNTL